MVGRRENAVPLSLRLSVSLPPLLSLAPSPCLRGSVAFPQGKILGYPASAFSDLSQSHIGVGRHGMSHHGQQMSVRKTIGVSERTLQIEAGGAIDRRQAFGFRHTERMRRSEEHTSELQSL